MKPALFPLAAVAALLLAPKPAFADEALCVDRPGLDTPPCTLHAGRVMVETGALTWEHSADAAAREDDLTLADTVVRIGLGSATEMQIGLDGWNHRRTRDKQAGTVSTARGIGDTTLGLRHGFGGEDDAHAAIQAFVTLPSGRQSVSAGDWGAGVILPLSFDLPGGFSISASPEIDAAVNASGHGRHPAWGSSLGLSHALTPALALTGEVAAWRDQDPSGHRTDARLAASLAWAAGKSLQLDMEIDKGLASGAPDHALMLGFARQF